MRLHGDKTRPTVLVGGEQGFGKLPGVHRRRADVAGFARSDHIVQGFQRFFNRGFIIPAVDLV